jgi:HEAT repeat protein
MRKRKKPPRQRKKAKVRSNVVLIDHLKWEKRLSEGTVEEKIGAMEEALRKKDHTAIRSILKAMWDKDERVTEAAYFAVNSFGRDAIPEFINLLGPENHIDDVAEIISRMGVNEQQFQLLMDLARNPHSTKRAGAINTLGRLRDTRALNLLVDIIKEIDNVDTQQFSEEEGAPYRSAILALGEIGDKKVIELLADLSLSDDFDISYFADVSLRKLGVTVFKRQRE